MTLTYEQAIEMYRRDKIGELAETPTGVRFLLLRSLSRPEHMKALVQRVKFNADNIKNKELLKALFESSITIEQIKNSIKCTFDEERAIRLSQEPELIAELYKMHEFYWGGLHQNSLEKTIVNNYVKNTRLYDELNAAIEGQIFTSMKGYVKCSWYNHWTSIIIEDVFKDHECVIPAIGLVKKIDFFVNDIPFDLKVTYLPEGYVKEVRKSRNLRPELTLLKKIAREKSIAIDKSLSDSDLLDHLWRMIADHPDPECQTTICEMKELRIGLVDQIEENPGPLIKWLYENQGVSRFDAANRLFLVLINEDNFFQSWQLKRNRTLILDKVNEYLSDEKNRKGRAIQFHWENQLHNTVSNMIVVRHRSRI